MPLPAGEAPVGRQLMREAAYSRLVQLIVEGTLEPGEVVRDQAVAAWLGTSRTPVREALSRLADDGLVEMAPNRFTRVAPLSPPAIADAHRLLALLEGELAAALAAPTEAPGARVLLTDELARAADDFTWALWRGDVGESLAADRAVHRLLHRVASRPRLHAIVYRLEPLARRAQRAAWSSLAAGWPIDRHVELIASLRAGDGEAARRAVAAEWSLLGDSVTRAVSQR